MTAPDDVRARLLPCPFCGCGIPEMSGDGEPSPMWRWIIKCQDCPGQMRFVSTKSRDDAIAAWNRRAAHADMAGEVRELAEEVFDAINDGDAQSARSAALAALAKHTHQEKP